MTGGAHDTLRDDLAEAGALAWRSCLESERSQGFPVDDNIAGERYGVAALPVVRRYADAQVAAERERIAVCDMCGGQLAAERQEALISYRVRLPGGAWLPCHPSDVEVVYKGGGQP